MLDCPMRRGCSVDRWTARAPPRCCLHSPSLPPDGSRADVIAADRTDALDTRVDTDVAPPSDASDAVMDAGVDAGEPAVRFVGRIDRTDSAGPRFGWSGSGIVARFHGTSVSVSLRDPGNYFHVLVDGTAQPTLQAMSGTTP